MFAYYKVRVSSLSQFLFLHFEFDSLINPNSSSLANSYVIGQMTCFVCLPAAVVSHENTSMTDHSVSLWHL